MGAWEALPVLLAVGLVTLHLVCAGTLGFTADELYLIACSKRLDLAYVDHPPLSVWLIWLVRSLFGDSILALRALPAVAGAATMMVTARLAGELGAGPRARALAALGVFSCAGLQAHFDQMTMNAFDVLFTTLAAWSLVRVFTGRSGRSWLAFGVIAGVALENKLTMLAFGAGVACALICTRERRWLATRWPWGAALVALALFAPFLWWQSSHAWIGVEWVASVQHHHNRVFTVAELVLKATLVFNPLTLPLWSGGLGWLLRGRGPEGIRALGVVALVFLGIHGTRPMKVYYLLPIIPLLYAAGAVALDRLATTRRRSRLLAGYAGWLLGANLVVLPHVIPLLAAMPMS